MSVEDLRSEVDRDHNVIYGSRVGEEGVEGFGTIDVVCEGVFARYTKLGCSLIMITRNLHLA